MDEVLGSECSSGCESGWTLYLEYDSYGHDHEFVRKKGVFTQEYTRENEQEEEEDLSMVSDASSGPPHFQEEDVDLYNNGCYFYHPPPQFLHATLPKNEGKMQKSDKNLHRKVQELPSYLDDTASSPFFNFSNNNLTVANNQGSMENIVDFSQGYSTTYLQGKSTFQDHFGFFHSSVSGTQLQQNQWFEGKSVGMR